MDVLLWSIGPYIFIIDLDLDNFLDIDMDIYSK